ncbi:MAG TPA: hypothetical protein VE982_01870 [Gaiellaceae bacterium]|nr:hypothetical protein [Gaiellaceae bacterium]
MDETQRRKAANEAVFREVNERIEALQRGFALTEKEPLHLVCECDRLDCMERLSVTVDAYELVRSRSDQFIVAEGHEDPAVERIVDTGADYLVVRKRAGEPREIAEETDPRS